MKKTMSLISKSIISVFLFTILVNSAFANKKIGKSTGANRVKTAKEIIIEKSSVKSQNTQKLQTNFWKNIGVKAEKTNSNITIDVQKAEAKLMIQVLQTKGIKTASLKNAILNNSEVKQSMKNIISNIKILSKKDVQIMVQFAVNVQKVSHRPENQSYPHSVNVIIDLLQNMADTANWNASSRSSFIGLLKEISTQNKKGKGIDFAVTQSLKSRGYNSVEDIIERMKQIREKCKKVA